MTRWTDADHAVVKSAYLQASIDGIASVSVSGQEVKSYSLDELGKMLDRIERDILTAGASDRPGGGLMFQQITPVYR